MNETVAKALVAQRMRNRTIEYLEWVRTPQEHRAYQRAAPIANVPCEAINQWEDFMGADGLNEMSEPLYSGEEMGALREFHEIWDNVCTALPDALPPLDQLVGNSHWQRLTTAASTTHAMMMKRGPYSDDVLERFQCPH
ncbi:MAG: hypothetical protein GY717_11855 [Rhodobacteraceae bacterium]|nr:hypothetical protein [Paracoccaceae bacterium]